MLPTKRSSESSLLDSILQESNISKTAFDKFAGFPSVFLQLKPDVRDHIAKRYAVGPNSTQTEISLSQATKKPYSEQLLVYTTSVLSEKEQQDASDMMDKKRRELEKELRDDPQYQKLKGSQAGYEYEKEKIDGELEKYKVIVDKKFTPKERPVAWGEGTYFSTNNDLFSWHYGRRGGWSDAPKSRKELIAYITRYDGKVYAISEDADAKTKRRERSKNAPSSTSAETRVIKERAKKLGEEKKKELDKIVDKYFKNQKESLLASATKSFDDAIEKIKAGKEYGTPTITLAINQKLLERISQAYYKILSDSDPLGSYYGTFDEIKRRLVEYSKSLNNLIATIKAEVEKPVKV